MKTALICIAKDEDRYIDEWIRYHLKLGFDGIFVYQNNWRYSGDTRAYGGRVKWIEFDGMARQIVAYNDFIDSRSSGFDFAAFFDCDEFLRLPVGVSLADFLSSFNQQNGICVNWRLFGDSGLAFDGKEYSVLKRFVKCQDCLNRHVKTILNVAKCGKSAHFVNPHYVDMSVCGNFISDTAKTRYVRGPWNDNPMDSGVWLNHYFCKTRQEFEMNKIPRGKADTPVSHPEYLRKADAFDEHNFNDVEDRNARDFMYE